MTLGFMQGRLSPQVSGKIQAFPAAHWRGEFPAAQKLGLHCMEWTLDHEGLKDNPLMTPAGRTEIRMLCAAHGVSIPSLTGDCFMQAPFWKVEDPAERALLLDELDSILHACSAMQIGIVVVPLVDNGSVATMDQEKALREHLTGRAAALRDLSVKIAFETDLPPEEVASWIAGYPEDVFGVNYDTGNSASLGFEPETEWELYGRRILNVHIKDRAVGGTTVPLGEGDCDFTGCFRAVKRRNYTGSMILQTARAADGGHVEALARYRDFVETAWKSAEVENS